MRNWQMMTCYRHFSGTQVSLTRFSVETDAGGQRVTLVR